MFIIRLVHCEATIVYNLDVKKQPCKKYCVSQKDLPIIGNLMQLNSLNLM